MNLQLFDGVARFTLAKDFTVSLRAGAGAVPSAGAPLATKTHYLIGGHAANGPLDVASFGRVTYASVFRGVDLVYHGDDGRLEYDFELGAGADVDAITVDVEGASVRLAQNGELVMSRGSRAFSHAPPRVYQRAADGREELVAGNYRIVNDTSFGFEVGSYDRARPLVIDPVLSYGTYLGGADGDFVSGVAVDASGNTYVTGYTLSANFPTQNALQGARSGTSDAFVAKLNPAGTALVWATYFGGSDYDYANAIAIDDGGNVFIAGQTASTDLPTQSALQPSLAGGGYDGFVAKLSPNGASLLYSTYLGGTDNDSTAGLAVDAAGNAVVLLAAYSTDIATVNAAQPTSGGNADGYLTKLTPAGARTYATYLGGSGVDFAHHVAIDGAGNAYVTGQTYSTDFPTLNPLQAANAGYSDVFVTKYTSAGARVFSTYLGGGAGTGYDFAQGVAVDSGGNVILTGGTESSDFPTTSAMQPTLSGRADAFLTKIAANGASLVYSTYLGGSASDYGKGVVLDGSGNVFVTGTTTSTNFPTKLPIQAANAGGTDVFMAKLAPSGASFVYATYLGGSGADDYPFALAVDAKGVAVIVGQTTSSDFPTKNPYQAANGGGDRDGFIVKITTPLLVTPATASVLPLESVSLQAADGSGVGYVFALTTNASGASIGASSGAYVAGSTPNVTDVVRVTDSLGNQVLATITVGAGPGMDGGSSGADGGGGALDASADSAVGVDGGGGSGSSGDGGSSGSSGSSGGGSLGGDAAASAGSDGGASGGSSCTVTLGAHAETEGAFLLLPTIALALAAARRRRCRR